MSRSPLYQNDEHHPSKGSLDQIHSNTEEGNLLTAPISNPDHHLLDKRTDVGNRRLSSVESLSVRTSHPDLSARRDAFPIQSKPTDVADNSPSGDSSFDIADDLLPSSHLVRKRMRRLSPRGKIHAAKVRKIGACDPCRERKVMVCLIYYDISDKPWLNYLTV